MPIFQIKLPIPNRYRSKVAKIILDWVEAWPKFQGGYIQSLQEQRSEQRESAQMAYEQTRPPEGSALDLLTVRMIEMVQYEDFQTLKNVLERMFPNLDRFRLDKSFSEYFEELGDSLLPGWWLALGWIYR